MLNHLSRDVMEAIGYMSKELRKSSGSSVCDDTYLKVTNVGNILRVGNK